MKKVKLEVIVEFSQNEMKEFLINKGYRIEEHECVTLHGFFDKKDNLDLALSVDNNEINASNEYKLVFEKLIKESFNNKIKNLVLND